VLLHVKRTVVDHGLIRIEGHEVEVLK